MLVLLLGVGGGSCTLNDLVAVVPGRDAGTGGDGPDAGGPLDAREAYCARPGPAWIVDPVRGGEACVGHLVGRAFTWAVCSGEGISASASFVTNTLGATPGLGSVWTGGSFHASAQVDVGGSLQVDSPDGVLL